MSDPLSDSSATPRDGGSKTGNAIRAVVVRGHRVASGQNGNARFPGGTLHMQTPYFQKLGLDLNAYHRGTVNISIAPLRYEVVKARVTFRQVEWHPTAPPEDFSFFDAAIRTASGAVATGLVYYPHPDTKPEHFQQPDVLELLLPFVPELRYGDEIALTVPPDQMVFSR